MIEHALQRVGAGRSLVATKEGTIIAGNATLDAAASAGIEEAIVIRTDGTRLIIHQRDDLSDSDVLSTELALLDNRSAELATWDREILEDLRNDTLDLTPMWSSTELADLFMEERPAEALDTSPQLGVLEYRVIVDCASEQAQAELIAELEARGLIVKALIS